MNEMERLNNRKSPTKRPVLSGSDTPPSDPMVACRLGSLSELPRAFGNPPFVVIICLDKA
jgi:hypothetical protein